MITTVSAGGLDYENPTDNGADNVYDLNITATDSSGNVTAQSLSLSLQDFLETYALATSGNTVNTIDPRLDETNKQNRLAAIHGFIWT